ncbi:MAG TPA: glyceraldehyde-3-phosphate dehydrogenase, partial [Desulfobacteraceae bacterium]|nr:glyceraldehyde-3-phosphate dehydrogenase [Desulfobacteraceae bacterium]
MDDFSKNIEGKDLVLGINGLGRIGKLTLWHHIARKYFDELVVNLGRDVGTSLKDLAHYMERDSTYGSLGGYLYGHKARRVIQDIDETAGTMTVDGIRVSVLQRFRNPGDMDWREHGVRLVV